MNNIDSRVLQSLRFSITELIDIPNPCSPQEVCIHRDRCGMRRYRLCLLKLFGLDRSVTDIRLCRDQLSASLENGYYHYGYKGIFEFLMCRLCGDIYSRKPTTIPWVRMIPSNGLSKLTRMNLDTYD